MVSCVPAVPTAISSPTISAAYSIICITLRSGWQRASTSSGRNIRSMNGSTACTITFITETMKYRLLSFHATGR